MDEKDLDFRQYLLLNQSVCNTRQRLFSMEAMFFAVNILLFGIICASISIAESRGFALLIGLMMATIGMIFAPIWTAASLRRQLKLRLIYFMLRELERSLFPERGGIFTAKGSYFNPKEGVVESKTGKHRVCYPKSMDGFIGRMKQRTRTWTMPLLFFIAHLYTFAIIFASLVKFS
jgi:hypothetical protein